MTKLYGIKNCDTVKKARKWLDSHKVSYEFHDFRTDGLSEAQLRSWLSDLGAASLINRRSTTWKQLSDAEKNLFDESPLSKAAVAKVIDQPTLIKRPVVESENKRIVGFNEAQYEANFN